MATKKPESILVKALLIISKQVRRSDWTECCIEIFDIGYHSFWGNIVDLKSGKIVKEQQVFNIDDEWLNVDSSQETIKHEKKKTR